MTPTTDSQLAACAALAFAIVARPAPSDLRAQRDLERTKLALSDAIDTRDEYAYCAVEYVLKHITAEDFAALVNKGGTVPGAENKAAQRRLRALLEEADAKWRRDEAEERAATEGVDEDAKYMEHLDDLNGNY